MMETLAELKEICQSSKRNKPVSRFLYLVHRDVSIYITWVLLRFFRKWIHPNYVSLFNMLCMVPVMAATLALGRGLWSLVGAALGYFSFLLDKVDGEIARYKDMSSVRGVYLDQLYHLLLNGSFCLAITLNAFWLTESSTVLVVGTFCVFFVTINRFNRKLFYSILAKARFLDIPRSTPNSSASRWKRILDVPLLKIFSPFTRPDFVLVSYFVVSLIGTLIAREAEAKRLYLMLYALASAGYFVRFSLIYFFYGAEEEVHKLNRRFLETHEREMERLSRQQR